MLADLGIVLTGWDFVLIFIVVVLAILLVARIRP